MLILKTIHAIKKKDWPNFGTTLIVPEDPIQYQNIVHAIHVKLIRNQVVGVKVLEIEAHLGILVAFGTTIHSVSAEIGLVNSTWSRVDVCNPPRRISSNERTIDIDLLIITRTRCLCNHVDYLIIDPEASQGTAQFVLDVLTSFRRSEDKMERVRRSCIRYHNLKIVIKESVKRCHIPDYDEIAFRRDRREFFDFCKCLIFHWLNVVTTDLVDY
ncbi:hypothetical protein GEV33_002374 [Tenebrio molitor]|uniref:Uncharacterized protein n=1 Tax=Tenebrio molitor TaxID=7067 RepID=A0A8J6LIX0_TENMO|nr:hypothetical protein GEV33_002374 [Tenebrio molitor]